MDETLKIMVAVFPKMDRAVKFEARLNEGRDGAVEISRKGKTVTFKIVPHIDEFGVTRDEDFRGLVAYFGSAPGMFAAKSKVAFLNGVHCIGEF